MCSYGVSAVSIGGGERGGWMVYGTSLALGSIARSGASGGRRLGLTSTMSWWMLGSFWKMTEGDLVMRSCVNASEERMWGNLPLEFL